MILTSDFIQSFALCIGQDWISISCVPRGKAFEVCCHEMEWWIAGEMEFLHCQISVSILKSAVFILYRFEFFRLRKLFSDVKPTCSYWTLPQGNMHSLAPVSIPPVFIYRGQHSVANMSWTDAGVVIMWGQVKWTLNRFNKPGFLSWSVRLSSVGC